MLEILTKVLFSQYYEYSLRETKVNADDDHALFGTMALDAKEDMVVAGRYLGMCNL